jgi:hypothetical protein
VPPSRNAASDVVVNDTLVWLDGFSVENDETCFAATPLTPLLVTVIV